MKNEKGLAYCGLACAVCGENENCAGCRNDGCKNKERCKHFVCCKEKNIRGCWECDNFPCGGMHEKVRIYALALFIKEHGEERLLECLERNEKNGIVYHYPNQIIGDYDKCKTADEVMDMIMNGKIMNGKGKIKI